MKKYTFANGGETDNFFSDYVDMASQQSRNNTMPNDQEISQDTSASTEESDFIKGLNSYDEENSGKQQDISMLESFSNKLSELEQKLSEQQSQYESDMATAAYMGSDEGNGLMTDMYDTDNQDVPYVHDNSIIQTQQQVNTGYLPQTQNQTYFNSSLGKQISKTHNNPLNIHYSEFAQKYNGRVGAKDIGGNVAIFPNLETGIQAGKDLLFGDTYKNLTIGQARNRWVTGETNKKSDSTDAIVKELGFPANTRLSDLSPQQKDRVIKVFAKWEGSEGYNDIKNIKLF